MRSRTVRHPDGETFRVSLRWMPWRPRIRRGFREGADVAGTTSRFAFEFDMVGCAFWLALVMLLVVLVPLLSLVLELVVVIAILFPLSIAVSVLGLRPFEVEVEAIARQEERRLFVTQARGVPGASREIDRLSSAIRAGWDPHLEPPPAPVVSAVHVR